MRVDPAGSRRAPRRTRRAATKRSTTASPDPLFAILAPPSALRLREHLGVDVDAPVELATTGWCKVVVLVDDRAVLVPRNHRMVDPLRREIAVLEALRDVGLPGAPRLREVIEDDAISPYPLVVTDRVPGTSLQDLEPQLTDEQWLGALHHLGVALATVHAAGAPRLADRDPADHRVILHGVLDADPDVRHAALANAAEALDVPVRAADQLVDALSAAARLPRVVVHNDLHEAQVMVATDGITAGVVTGIVDWQTASVDHPFVDFDVLQWGVGALRRFEATPLEHHRRALWDGAGGDERLGRGTGALLDMAWALNDGCWAANHTTAPVTAFPLPVTLRARLVRRARSLLHRGT